jgi:hypothetical protein
MTDKLFCEFAQCKQRVASVTKISMSLAFPHLKYLYMTRQESIMK